MLEFLDAMEPFSKSLWYIALPTTLVFLIFFIMTLVGGDADTDADIDIDVDADGDMNSDAEVENSHSFFKMFSFKFVLNFIMIFSWTTIFCIDSMFPKFLAIFFGVVAGFAFACFISWALKMLMKLQQDNTPNYRDAIGQTVSVYLTVPSTGKGSIKVTVGCAMKVIDAKSLSGKEFKTKEEVLVVDYVNGIYVVDSL